MKINRNFITWMLKQNFSKQYYKIWQNLLINYDTKAINVFTIELLFYINRCNLPK